MSLYYLWYLLGYDVDDVETTPAEQVEPIVPVLPQPPLTYAEVVSKQ